MQMPTRRKRPQTTSSYEQRWQCWLQLFEKLMRETLTAKQPMPEELKLLEQIDRRLSELEKERLQRPRLSESDSETMERLEKLSVIG